MRYITQITAIPDTDRAFAEVIVLCSDNTLWRCDGKVWKKFIDIPQDVEEIDTPDLGIMA